MTVEWTVVLRTPEGVDSIPVVADFARNSDDGKWLVFSNVAPLDEAVSILLDIKDETPPAEAKEMLWKLIQAIGRVTVAQFRLEDVQAYFQDGNDLGPTQ